MLLSLHQAHILITRPYIQAGRLAAAITARGGIAHLFSTLEILPPSHAIQPSYLLEQLQTANFIIFTSRPAVEYALKLADVSAFLAKTVIPILAIGRATAALLQHHDIDVRWQPLQEGTSEVFLEHPQLQHMQNSRVIICKGEEGRDLIARTLQLRGATVIEIPLYRRAMPVVTVDELNTLLNQPIEIVVITSGDAFQNLVAFLGEAGKSWLQSKAFIVMSKRIASMAAEAGIKLILVAPETSDSGIILGLEQWYKTRNQV